jgi:DNA mismatch repair ATPase MutL
MEIKDSEADNPETEHENPEETKSTQMINSASVATDSTLSHQTEEEEKIVEGEEEEETICAASSNKHIESNKDEFEEEYEKVVKMNENFSKRVNLKSPGEVATNLLMEVNEYSCQLFSLWNEFIQLIMVDQSASVEYFKPVYQKLIYERW